MYYEGKVYRPWIEADSVLIQTTLGCSHNKCTFCDMFREKRFRIRSLENMDFETMYWGDHGNNILSLKGMLPESSEEFLKKVDQAIANDPVTGDDVLRTSSR